ncbi:MAG: PAS domain S-box protein [Acidobacteria bacterium]|nr:PAS domain S-box protein [Acidobacteriota bacterium]
MATNDVIPEGSLEELNTLEELRRRERELADFIENASMGLHWVGADGTILWANQAELDLLGYTREEYIGRSITEFHADSDVINDILCRLTNKETLHDYEARLKCKDGSVRHVLINSNVMWEDDKFVHTRCFTRDITERKRAEEELQKSKRQLEELLAREQMTRADAERQGDLTRLVLEGAPIAIGLMEGPDHRFALVNRVTCELTGLSEEQLIGRPHAEVLPEADRVVGPILDKVYTTGASVTDEIEVELQTGRRHLLVTWTALPGGGGRAGSVLYLSLDITDRKTAEQALRANEEQFRAVAETAPDAIITIDEGSTILFANRSTQKIFGHTWEELGGQPLTMLMPEYLRHLHQAGVKRFVETGQRHIGWEAVELPGLHKDGHEVPLEISFSEFFTKGKRHFTGIVRDITERERAQEALRESERQLRILADTVPQLVWMAEPDGHVFWYNERWYEYTGTTPEQMEGWGWQSVHDPPAQRRRRGVPLVPDPRQSAARFSRAHRALVRDEHGRGRAAAHVGRVEGSKPPEGRISRHSLARAAYPAHRHPRLGAPAARGTT